MAIIAEHELIFELQMPLSDAASVDLLVSILQKLPDLKIIINHLGWPPIDNQDRWNIWEHHIELLSQFKNVAVKLSGWEMMTPPNIKPFISKHLLKKQTMTHCVKCFSIDRVMLASNFPLCLFEQSYQMYWQTMIAFIAKEIDLQISDIEKLCHKNAKHWYKF